MAGQATVVAAVVLVLALSLCAFDRNGDGLDEGLDACAIAILTAAGVTLLAAPAVVSRSPGERPWFVSDASLHLPDPPPKSALSI